jgi:hypothetical protein
MGSGHHEERLSSAGVAGTITDWHLRFGIELGGRRSRFYRVRSAARLPQLAKISLSTSTSSSNGRARTWPVGRARTQ